LEVSVNIKTYIVAAWFFLIIVAASFPVGIALVIITSHPFLIVVSAWLYMVSLHFAK
jgi:hypothetical protein